MNKRAAGSGRVEPTDHPLVPNARLRQVHASMLALRGRGRAAKAGAAAAGGRGEGLRGMEAMLASSLLSLRLGDLVSLPAEAGTVELRDRALGVEAGVRSLPALGSGTERVLAAMGAVAAMRGEGSLPTSPGGEAAGGGLLLVSVMPGEVRGTEWSRLLELAREAALPVIFAVLPVAAGRAAGAERAAGKIGAAGPRPGWLAARAQGWGVPGIPVDADDPVALFRVLGESALRARAGDGPTLVEAVVWAPASRDAKRADPVRAVEQVLTRRGQPLPDGSAAGRRTRRV